ncbi:LysR family transcriptional regulator [Bradyrhizobium sp. Leo121]|uniref:LysR family transcriptional regulator n=1 Tax=Bradyrhizobium sp. Leo121 TaxID=1571195 RepID=UPI00102A0B55|nr:LysR family transcriptional regulator [Bradyrhizobium sp. Leo121]RZN14090.1 LysR family transcriptional regulator [Bradyrhizobium sp. Leo121]
MPFDGRLLAGISVLAAVVQTKSFARAADTLGITASGVSRAVARLEARVGVRLFDRTTRSVALTDEGRRFYEQVAPLLAGIEDAASTASGSSGVVRGRLRVDIDPYFSRMILSGHIGGFLRQHPELTLELITREHVGDLVADGIDVAMRFGEPPAGPLIARRLLETRVLTVASPGYLRKHGRPKHPGELQHHPCIQFVDPLSGQLFEWEFHAGKKVLPVKTSSALVLTDVGTMINECIAGTGIAQLLAIGVQPLLDSGRLIELFPDWPGETFPLYALHPSRHHPPAKVRAFIDFALKAAQGAARSHAK